MQIPHKPGCYILNHIETGCFYIGSTGDLYRRYQQMMTSLRLGNNHNPRLQGLYDEDDRVEFEYFPAADREHAYDIEQSELDLYQRHPQCLNVLTDARKGYAVGDMPEHNRRAIGEAAKITHLNNTYSKGIIRSEETRSKQSQSLKEHWKTREGRRERIVRKPQKNPRGPIVGETLERMTESAIARGIKLSKPVTVCGIPYHNAGYAATALNITRRTVMNRIKSTNSLWSEWTH